MHFPINIFSFQFFAALIFALIVRFFIKLWLSRKSLPPGPVPFPFLGNMLELQGKPGAHLVLMQMSKIYGDVMTIFLGNKPHVVLSKYDVAKEILPLAAFSDRPDSFVVSVFLENTPDIVMGKYGPVWQLYKKAAAKSLRTIIEAEKLEEKVVEAVDVTAEKMLKNGKLEPTEYMKHIVYNTISLFAFGKAYQMDDAEFLHLIYVNETSNKEVLNLANFDFVPFAEYLPLKRLPNFQRAMKIFDQEKDFCRKQIYEHKRTYDGGEPRDFCDAMIQEQKQLEKEGELQLTDQIVSMILLDFFNAGTDTTSTTLTWFILFMVVHLDLQEECYRNIKEAIGDRSPRLSDRQKIPLVDACILETLRLRPVAPTGLHHATNCDAKIGNYSIPKGTSIIANLYAMHMDPAYWKNPDRFDPRGRFIDAAGQVKIPLSFVPFGFGRRVCLGEQLAKKDMFLTAVRLLQKLRFEPIDGESYSVDGDPNLIITLRPLPFSVRVTARE